jgi:photosystem II stability/assembly factor-like uncharacterized protein
VWGLVDGDVVAVGAGGVVIATDGVAPWAVVPAFTARDLNAVWADKPGDWFAVGDAGEIWQDRGAGWMPMSSPRGDDFHDVFGSDSAYVWAVGDADSILFYDQIAWRPIAPNPSGRLDAIWATICPLSLAARGAARDVHCSNTYFAGAGGFLAYYTLLNTYDDLTDAVTHADLHGIHGAANGDVYAVGDESTIMRYDGSSWSRAPTGDSQLQDVFVISPLDVVVVGFTRGPFAGGCVMEGADNAWTGICAPSYPDFYGVWARNAAEVYIVGNAGTVYRNNRITMEPEPAPLADYRDVWGFESGEPIAVALGGVIAMRDAGTWSAMPDPVSSDLYGVWGTSPSHAYAVGANGVILRLDASGVWQSMISGVADDIVAVSGDDGTVWAVTRTGSALRLDGTTWRIEPWPGIAGYGGVYVRSDRGVFAVGNAGGVVRFDLRS